jgi:dipeptidyl aminopeptidase/acylaminoacyl peptidase
MAWIWVTAIFVILTTGMGWLTVFLFRNKRTLHHKTPGEYDIQFEEVEIPANDGGTLSGWWLPSTVDSPVLILAHGWSSNMGRFLPYMRKLHEEGYSLLAFNARNHGCSSALKNPTVWTFSQDILSAAQYLREREKVSDRPIGVIGHSIGGSAAINAASQDNTIHAVISIGAFAHPIELMKIDLKNRHIPICPFGWLLFKYLRYFRGIDFDRIAPVRNIPSADAHILLVHGKRDDQVPVFQAEELYKASNPERTQLWIMEESGHNDCHHHPEFWPNILAFIEQNLRKRS